MSKFLLIIFSISIILTGCKDKEEPVVEDQKVIFSEIYDSNTSHQFADYQYNLNISVSTENLNTTYNYNFIFDYDNKLAKGSENYLDVVNSSYFDFKNNVTYTKEFGANTYTKTEGILSSYSSMQNISKVDSDELDKLDYQVTDLGNNIYEFRYGINNDLLNTLFTQDQLDVIRKDFDITSGYVIIKLNDGVITKTEANLVIMPTSSNDVDVDFDTVKIEVTFDTDTNVTLPSEITE